MWISVLRINISNHCKFLRSYELNLIFSFLNQIELRLKLLFQRAAGEESGSSPGDGMDHVRSLHLMEKGSFPGAKWMESNFDCSQIFARIQKICPSPVNEKF